MTPDLHNLTPAEAAEFERIAEAYKTGVALIPRPYGTEVPSAMHSAGGDFAKWLKQEHKDVEVHLPTESQPRVMLHCHDYWFPLIWLGSTVVFPVFINMLSSYLYDKAKGTLKGEKPNAHVEVVFKDEKNGTFRRFKFEGDVDQLKAAVKKFDPNEFLNGDEK